MISYTELAFLKSIIFLLPIWLVGINVTRWITSEKRAEVIIPAGLIGGITLYIFSLNILSYIFHPPQSIFLSFLLFILISAVFVVNRSIKLERLDFPKGRSLQLVIISLIIWGGSLFWDAGQVNFGGDVSLYYNVAKTFAHGNFPLQTPWQPDLTLDYHYGGPIFLGAIQTFVDLRFDFIQRLTVFSAIFALSQIFVWMWKRHESIKSFLLHQLIPIIGLITLGTFMLVWPVLPLQLPPIDSLKGLVLWAREVPSVHISFETYGAPVILELIIYFIHHALGLAAFFWILFLSLNISQKNKVLGWFIIALANASLALINEAIFVPALVVSVFLILISELRQRSLFKNFKKLSFIAICFGFIILFQGGIINFNFMDKVSEESSSIIFLPLVNTQDLPAGEETLKAIIGYHERQQASKLFPVQENWLPFHWYHIGILWLYIIVIISIFILLKKDKLKAITISALALAALTSTVIYNLVVPDIFLHANSNRLLALTYHFLGLSLVLIVVWIIEFLINEKRKILLALSLFLIFWVMIPTLLPTVGLLSKLRHNHPNNLLVPEVMPKSTLIDWLEKNVGSKERVLDLVMGLYYTSSLGHSPRVFQSLSEYAGVLMPTFDSQYRAYTTEAGPLFLDAIYTLNPSRLEELKINFVVTNNQSLLVLPEIRQKQLTDPKYFDLVFEMVGEASLDWERVYKVKDEYLKVQDLPGTFAELDKILPKKADVYIDSWKEGNIWGNLRKALIFTLEGRRPYLIWGPGAYLNVKRNLDPIRVPKEGDKYDYLVLHKSTDPEMVCKCQVQLIWQGLNGEILLWRVI